MRQPIDVGGIDTTHGDILDDLLRQVVEWHGAALTLGAISTVAPGNDGFRSQHHTSRCARSARTFGQEAMCERQVGAAYQVPISYASIVLGHLLLEPTAECDWRQRGRDIARCIARLYMRYKAGDAYASTFGYPEVLLGHSPAVVQMEWAVERLSHWDVPVLIVAEFGCQQRAVASLLHVSGSRNKGPLLTFNCLGQDAATLADRLAGPIESAAGGSLFLEGLDLLSKEGSYALAAVLAERCRYDGSRSRAAPSVRLIASVAPGAASAPWAVDIPVELLTSVDVVRVYPPSLRARTEDIEVIVRHAAERLSCDGDPLGPGVLQVLCQYSWPGNIDELERVVARLLALTGTAPISLADVRTHAPEIPALFGESMAVFSSDESTGRDPPGTDSPHRDPPHGDPPDLEAIGRELLEENVDRFEQVHPALRDALLHLGRSFHDDIRAPQLARQANISTSHLSHLFKRELGVTFKQVLSQIRIERAKVVLRQDEVIRITDVAIQVGFGDLSHFLKTFRRLVGSTPKEFRELHQSVRDLDVGRRTEETKRHV